MRITGKKTTKGNKKLLKFISDLQDNEVLQKRIAMVASLPTEDAKQAEWISIAKDFGLTEPMLRSFALQPNQFRPGDREYLHHYLIDTCKIGTVNQLDMPTPYTQETANAINQIAFPVYIEISRHAGIDDAHDYLDQYWGEIVKKRNQTAGKSLRIRSRAPSVRLRDHLIYQMFLAGNNTVVIKKTIKLLMKDTGADSKLYNDLGLPEINAIISHERKRRHKKKLNPLG